jgi:hypothetical protein
MYVNIFFSLMHTKHQRKVTTMGRRKKGNEALVLKSAQMVYKPSIEKEWLSILAGFVETEIRRKIQEGVKDA